MIFFLKIGLKKNCYKLHVLEDYENLPSPDILARDIAINLEYALEQFKDIYEDLKENKIS